MGKFTLPLIQGSSAAILKPASELLQGLGAVRSQERREAGVFEGPSPGAGTCYRAASRAAWRRGEGNHGAACQHQGCPSCRLSNCQREKGGAR